MGSSKKRESAWFRGRRYDVEKLYRFAESVPEETAPLEEFRRVVSERNESWTGAKAWDILGWILRQSPGTYLAAVPLGIALALAAALLALLLLTVVASCLPVLSALRLNLVRVLRHE